MFAAILIATAAPPDTGELGVLALQLLEAILHGQWWAAAAATVALLMLALRLGPWPRLKTIPVQVIGSFVLAALGGVLNVLVAGDAFTLEVLTAALKIGAAAATTAGGLPALLAWWKNRSIPPGPAAAALLIISALAFIPSVASGEQLYGAGTKVTCPAAGEPAVALEDATIPASQSRLLTIYVPAGETVVIGGVAVTADSGMPVEGPEYFGPRGQMMGGRSLYCVSATSSPVEVRVLAALP